MNPSEFKFKIGQTVMHRALSLKGDTEILAFAKRYFIVALVVCGAEDMTGRLTCQRQYQCRSVSHYGEMGGVVLICESELAAVPE